MPLTAWPTDTDILTALGGQAPTGVDLEGVAAQASQKAYAILGYPFIAGSSADYRFSAPYGDILYPGFWFSTVTAVRVGVTDSHPGTLLTSSQYRLGRHPIGPIRSIHFPSDFIGCLDEIQVTGVAGWDDEIPADVWNAVLNLGRDIALDMGRSISGVVTEERLGDRSIKYAESVVPESWLNSRMAAFRSAVGYYRPSPGVF